MRTKVTFLAGAAVGYVLGARAGRERYEQIVQLARRGWEDPRVQQAVGDVEQRAAEAAKSGGSGLAGKAQSLAGGLVDQAAARVGQHGPGAHARPEGPGPEWDPRQSGEALEQAGRNRL